MMLLVSLDNALVLFIIELFSLGAFVLSQYTRLTDERTDGQTRSRHIQRWHSLQQCGCVVKIENFTAYQPLWRVSVAVLTVQQRHCGQR